MIFKILALLASLAAVTNAQRQNITYSIIASPANFDMSVAVVVDNIIFPLSAIGTNSLLYQGGAPSASNEYHYAIIDSAKHINASESFTRSPIQSNTLNEFFNRTKNTHELVSLPQVYDPLYSMNRIKSDLHIQGQIPTMHIWGNETAVAELHGKQLEDLNVQLNLTYYGLDNVQSFENVKVSLAGRSSRYLSKLSYTLKMKTKGTDNLFGYKKLKLRALGMDATYVRECIGYATLKAVGLPVSDFSYIRLFINNKPAGLYGLIETFQDPWLANEFANGDENYKSGLLYQGETQAFNQSDTTLFSDLKYYGENVTKYSLGQYNVKAGYNGEDETPEDYTQLKEFTKFINTTTKDTTFEEWDQRLDIENYIRAISVENLLGFSDSYMTLANNYYLYSDPKSSGRMIYIPSDLDTILGIALFKLELIISGNYSIYPGFNIRPLTTKLFHNEAILDAYQKKLLDLTQNLINPTVMYPFIDSAVSMIYPDIEWDATLTGFGQFPTPPIMNGSVIPSFFPDGMRYDWSDVPQTFDSALNGPTNSTTMESVKGFIQKKSDHILAFYNQT